jgi:uncharacterized protein (DUF1501 family)
MRELALIAFLLAFAGVAVAENTDPTGEKITIGVRDANGGTRVYTAVPTDPDWAAVKKSIEAIAARKPAPHPQ